MKELKINVFSFAELSKEVQDKVIERERWNVMDSVMECNCLEFQKALDEFQKITDSYVSSYQVDYCGCRFGKVRSDKIVYDDFDLEDLKGKLLFRYIDNEIMPYLQRGKFYSTYDKGNYAKFKSRRSRIIMESFDGCPLTGVMYDYIVLKPLFDYYYNWARPEYRNLTFCDVMEECYAKLFDALHEEYQYYASDEAVREELLNREDEYYEDGEQCVGYVRSVS